MVALTITRREAAALCSLSVTGFDSWVRRGIVPGPVPGTRRWSRAAIERALTGGAAAAGDPESVFERWEKSHAG